MFRFLSSLSLTFFLTTGRVLPADEGKLAHGKAPSESLTSPLMSPVELAQIAKLQEEIKLLETTISGTTPEIEKEQAVWENRLLQPVVWQPLETHSFDCNPGVIWEKQTDASILVKSGVGPKTTFRIKGRSTLRGITAIRLEALSDDTLPNRGPGHSSNGNAVINEINVHSAPAKPTITSARFVRVDTLGKGRFLHLAEVQVFSGKNNVALKGKASQISTDYGGEASHAIDGNTAGEYKANSTTHSTATDNPWWEVDLGQEYPIDKIVVWNRTDGELETRLNPFKLSALNEKRGEVWVKHVTETPSPSYETSLSDNRTPLKLINASATYSQQGWPVAHAIDGNSKSGWAFSPHAGENQTAVFEISNVLDYGPENDAVMEFAVVQEFGEDHTLGRFRLSTTNSPAPIIVLPDAAKTILNKVKQERSAAERKILDDLFRPYSKVLSDMKTALEAKRKALSDLKPTPIPVNGDSMTDHGVAAKD